MEPTRQFSSSIGPTVSRDVENIVQREAGGSWAKAHGLMHAGDTQMAPYKSKKETINDAASKLYSKVRSDASKAAAAKTKSKLQHYVSNRKYTGEQRLDMQQRLTRNSGNFGGAS